MDNKCLIKVAVEVPDDTHGGMKPKDIGFIGKAGVLSKEPVGHNQADVQNLIATHRLRVVQPHRFSYDVQVTT